MRVLSRGVKWCWVDVWRNSSLARPSIGVMVDDGLQQIAIARDSITLVIVVDVVALPRCLIEGVVGVAFPDLLERNEVFKIYLKLWMIQSVSFDLFDSQFHHCSHRNDCTGHSYLGPDICRWAYFSRNIASFFLQIWRWERAYVYCLSKIRWLLLGLLKSKRLHFSLIFNTLS